MVEKFNEDLAAAKEAEYLVEKYFRLLGSDTYEFRNVSEDADYYYIGDLLAFCADGRRLGIEVKDDSRIAETGNVLCEESVYYIHGDYEGKGNMQSNYDIYCIVSKTEKKIYIIDFKKLKKIYRAFGMLKEIPHPDQITYCYLLPLYVIKQQGAFIAEIDYSGEYPVVRKYNSLEEEAMRIAKRQENNRKWRELVNSGLFAALK